MPGLAKTPDFRNNIVRYGFGQDEKTVGGVNEFARQSGGGMGKNFHILSAGSGNGPFEIEAHVLDVIPFFLPNVMNADGFRGFRNDEQFIVEILPVPEQGAPPILPDWPGWGITRTALAGR